MGRSYQNKKLVEKRKTIVNNRPWSAKKSLATMAKIDPVRKDLCTRKACRAPGASCVHTQTGDRYCVSCARKINEHNPGLVTIEQKTDTQ